MFFIHFTIYTLCVHKYYINCHIFHLVDISNLIFINFHNVEVDKSLLVFIIVNTYQIMVCGCLKALYNNMHYITL